MNKPVTKAVMESGLLDGHAVEQLRRWGLLSTVTEAKNFQDPGALVENIREAVEGKEVVELRATDLDIIRRYIKERKKGKLYVPNPEDESKVVALPVEYCITTMGEYVIPWQSDSIQDLLLHEKTYLKPAGEERVQFNEVRELYFDSQKAFVVCTLQEVQDG